MTILIVGLVLFLGTHSISIVASAWRDKIVTRMGLMSWQGVYSLIAITGFVLIIYGYGLARQDPTILYTPPTWLRHVSMLLLVFVFPLLLATYLPGRIQKATKHPMLAATKIWAFAHLLANGALADVVLFGAFLVWAVVDRISMKRRTPLPVPEASTSRFNDVIAIVLGLGLYVAFVLWLHTLLIGVSPISR
ncbi:NnrU family protein [Kaarinaea lacus]